MKTTTNVLVHCLVIASSIASASPIELVIYGASDSAAPIVVETMPTDNLELPFKWTFNAPEAGWPHRTTLLIQTNNQQLSPNISLAAYLDLDGSVSYTPGEPFGVSSMREHPAIELTDMSAITPRVNLWSGDCDRTTRTGTDWLNIGSSLYDRYEKTTATVPKNRVRIVRYSVDKLPAYKVGVDADVILEKDFTEESRNFLHEGDFLSDGDLDIDWKNFYTDVVAWRGTQASGCEVTNVTYLIVYNWDKSDYYSDKDTNTQVKANATLVTRRFDRTRTIPTPVSAYIHSTTTTTNYNFKFRIDNEDKWASWFGTTYTAFKVKVLNGSTEVWNSGIIRLPPRDKNGVYMFQTSQTFQTSKTLTWRVAVYNAKFKTDTLMKMETEGDPFSPAQPISSTGD